MDAGSLRLRIARRAAQEIRDGEVVNLGVGIPTLIADITAGKRPIFLHSENGILGYGPPPEQAGDEDLVDAGKRPITEASGMAYFDSSLSFGMIRGGHIDCSVMGALQVDETGAIANWITPGSRQLGVGGAMDLLAGARRVVITMTLTDGKGHAKLLPRCTFPITARREPSALITEGGVFQFIAHQLTLVEVAEDFTVDDIQRLVPARFLIAPDLKPFPV